MQPIACPVASWTERTTCRGAKRASCQQATDDSSKRQKTNRTTDSTEKPMDGESITKNTMKRLQTTLQCMSAAQRLDAAMSLPLHGRKALLKYMESQTIDNGAVNAKRGHKAGKRSACGATGGKQRLTPIKSTYGRSFFAQADVGLLRLYTRGNRDSGEAEKQQVVLSKIRAALDLAWCQDREKEPVEIVKVVDNMLSRAGTSQKKLQLRACVQMRAVAYVSRRHVITSRVTSLLQALRARTSLLAAREQSWAHLRQQWLRLLMMRRKRGNRHSCKQDAERYLDQAHAEHLQQVFDDSAKKLSSTMTTQQQQTEPRSSSIKQSRLSSSLLAHHTRAFSSVSTWAERMQLMLQRPLSEVELTRGI